MAETLTREELANKLGISEAKLHYAPTAPRLSRKLRRKLAKLQRRSS